MLRLTWAMVLISGLLVVSGCQHETSAASSSSSSTQTARDDEDDTNVGPQTHTHLEFPATVRPFAMVMYDSANEEVLRPYAERVAELVGTTAVQAVDRNPVCCMWIEITRWTPNPGVRGYIINNQPGGSTIQAVDEEQLRLAIERLDANAVRHDGYVELPNGYSDELSCQCRPGHVNEQLSFSVPGCVWEPVKEAHTKKLAPSGEIRPFTLYCESDSRPSSSFYSPFLISLAHPASRMISCDQTHYVISY